MKVEGELRSNKVGPYQFNSHASIWSQLCCWEAYPRKKNTHNVTILLTEDILNQFGKSYIYPIISHDSHRFFSKISPGVQTPSTIPLYYSMLLNSWMKPEKLHILPEFVVFFYFHVFFLGQFSNLNISRISYDFVGRHARPSHSLGFCLALKFIGTSGFFFGWKNSLTYKPFF